MNRWPWLDASLYKRSIRLMQSKATGRWSVYVNDFLVCEASDHAEGERFFAIVRQTLISLGYEVLGAVTGEMRQR